MVLALCIGRVLLVLLFDKKKHWGQVYKPVPRIKNIFKVVNQMNIQEIIIKKRDKKELSKEEIEFFIAGYTKGEITDYQAAALIMAIYLNGMTERETTDLAIAMANSGEILDLSDISNCIIDKHSTGGVGDKVSLILMPIIASLGVPVVKMSGRGLGFTGGTADKLESIPGYRIGLDADELKQNVKQIGICLASQTLDLAPADKKIYALRDAIACIDSIPLIASSIMSKKIAGGASKFVLEVMCGSGAFMQTREDAVKLCKQMKMVADLAEKEMICVLTNMDEPLGRSVGNTLEVIEATESLKGNISEDVKEVVCTLGAYILKLAGKGDNIEDNKKKIEEQIYNGEGYKKWKELVAKQGGDIAYIEDTNLFKKAIYEMPVIAEESGFVCNLDARRVGEISVNLGAGRIRKEDKIEKEAGIVLNKKVGDKVEKGDTLATIFANNKEKADQAAITLKEAYGLSEKQVIKPKEILGVIE